MAKTQKITFAKLKEIFDRAESEISRWEQSDGPDVSYEGQLVKALGPRIDIEFRRLIDASADEGCEVDGPLAMQVVMALDNFALEYARWLRGVATQVDTPRGNGKIWESWNRVRDAFAPIHNERPRGLKFYLEAANAPRDQICRIYGWVDADGQPEHHKIDEELAKPGTHYDEKNWKSPALKNRLATIEKEFSERQGSRKLLWPDMNDPDGKRAEQVPPPDLQTMVEAGAPAAQIARVHGIAIEKAEEMVKEHAEFKALEAVEKANAQKLAASGA